MAHSQLREKLNRPAGFIVLAELTGAPPNGFDFAGICLPQNPGSDSTVDGRCGNNLEHPCTGERFYEAAAIGCARRSIRRATRHSNVPRPYSTTSSARTIP